MVFIGDSEGDYLAAKKIGCKFIGLANSWNKWDKTGLFQLIINLSELETIIKNF